MKRTILQVPVTPELQLSAKRAAVKQGFSSLQDAVRMFLQQLSTGKTVVRLTAADDERLSPRAARRYAKIAKDIKSGKAKTIPFTSVDAMMKYLNT